MTHDQQPAGFNTQSIFLMLILVISLVPDALANQSNCGIEPVDIGGVPAIVRVPEGGKGEQFPLIIFSHGYRGSPNSTCYIQERLKGAGYMVIAPVHLDSSENSGPGYNIRFPLLGDDPNTSPRVERFHKPEDWADESFAYRRDEINTILQWLESHHELGLQADLSRIGCVGHSLGGYTCMGLAGAWDTWKNWDILATAGLSPWHRPYLSNHQYTDGVDDISTPILFQSGDEDDSSVKKCLLRPEVTVASLQNDCPGGYTFDQVTAPKYLQVFSKAKHASWTDPEGDPSQDSLLRDINFYLISFLNLYVKNVHRPDRQTEKAFSKLERERKNTKGPEDKLLFEHLQQP